MLVYLGNAYLQFMGNASRNDVKKRLIEKGYIHDKKD
jgi:hypothetical protein